MPRTTKALTDKEIKTAKAKTKEYKLFDQELHLQLSREDQVSW